MNTFTIPLFAAALGLSVGCAKKEAEPSKASSAKSPVQEIVKPAAAEHFLGALLSEYEYCRAALAADSVAEIPACSAGVVSAGHAAAAPEASKLALAAVVKAAEVLKSTPTDSIATIRLRFGDLSEAVIGLLDTAPTLANQYHFFECPMAKGYQGWVQSTEKLANPYMGGRMLRCGSEVR